MAEMIETQEKKERLILVGVSISEADDTERSLDELEELVDTAGGETVGRLVQNLDRINPGTYLGTGKVEELRQLVWEMDADGVVCDDELSPAQLRNLEQALDTKVMDRTLVILDIFASHAGSREGKLQVELAQLRYRATRLVGLRESLSRLGGGIGTRGPGEKKLEMDRRLIHERIGMLKAELKEVQQHREVTRAKRLDSHTPVAAIVGYTNAGKSTLLNALTDADILAEDKLFATLDPSTRKLELENGAELLLTDTVGFIRKLPHHLIEAFQGTLEEAKYADYILHVVDASNLDRDRHMYVVYETLQKLGVEGKPIITIFNKQDRVRELAAEDPTWLEPCRDLRADETIEISAGTGEGLEELKQLLSRKLREQKVYLERVFPYAEAGRIQQIRKYGELLEESYEQNGIAVKAYVPAELFEKFVH